MVALDMFFNFLKRLSTLFIGNKRLDRVKQRLRSRS